MEEEVANRSLMLALQYQKEEKPGRSYAHLLIVLKLKPQWKQFLEQFFISVLDSWDRYLTSNGRFSDLLASYEQALEHYKHHIIYNNLGILLNR